MDSYLIDTPTGRKSLKKGGNKIEIVTIKVIIASCALWLDETRGFSGPFIPRKLPPSSPPPLRFASIAWATNDDGLAQSYVSNDQRQGRDKVKAPLVDSSLLRFLSSEKRNDSVLVQEPNGKPSVGSVYSSERLNGEIREITVDLPTPATENFDLGESGDLADAGSSGATGFLFNEALYGQSWLSQYNARRVSLKLQALGVDNGSARKAGEIVQDYVLVRLTRRRIRKFLRERDALWESGSSTLLGRKGIDDSILPEAASNFDLDSVISVMAEFGLTGNDVAAVFSHTPSVVMMRAKKYTRDIQSKDPEKSRKSFTLEETLDKSFVGLLGKTLRLRRYDARKVLRASPGLLTSKGSASARQVVDLMISLGSSTNSIARDKASLPSLLCRSPALIFRLVAFLSSAEIKVPLSAIGPLLRQRQSAELLNAVAPVKQTFALCASDDILNRNLTTIMSESEILSYSKQCNTLRQKKIDNSYRSMEAVADVLRRYAGIRDFRKILSSHPNAFLLNVTNIHLMTYYLREEIGMSKDDIARAVQSFPYLLEQDVSRVKDVAEFLISIEVEEDSLPSILRSFPATLFLDVEEDMIPVVSFLRGIGVRNIGRFVTRLPPVLGYSLEKDLKPKWDFLKEVCQFDYFEIVRFPAYFSYPLERVIKMRYEYLRDCKGIPIQLARVDDVLRFGDRDFATEIALDDDGGAMYARFVKERSCALHPSIIRKRRKPKDRKSK